jgi:hypothetical protein
MKQHIQKYRWIIASAFTGLVLLFTFQKLFAQLTTTKKSLIISNPGDPVTNFITYNNITGSPVLNVIIKELSLHDSNQELRLPSTYISYNLSYFFINWFNCLIQLVKRERQKQSWQ